MVPAPCKLFQATVKKLSCFVIGGTIAVKADADRVGKAFRPKDWMRPYYGMLSDAFPETLTRTVRAADVLIEELGT